MSTPAIHITVLGSGTSSGVPTIGCTCEVCLSADPRDKRLRPSILLQYDGRNVVVDTTPDFRQQVLRAGIGRLDAILYTHAHADHILGLDDVRPFNFRQRESIPVYGTEDTLTALQRVFCYAFDEKIESMVPKLDLRRMDENPFELFGVEFVPIRLVHGKGTVCKGWTCCFWMLSGIVRIRRIRRWNVPWNWCRRSSRSGHSSRTCATICIMSGLRRCFRRTSGWLTTAWRLTWKHPHDRP